MASRSSAFESSLTSRGDLSRSLRRVNSSTGPIQRAWYVGGESLLTLPPWTCFCEPRTSLSEEEAIEFLGPRLRSFGYLRLSTMGQVRREFRIVRGPIEVMADSVFDAGSSIDRSLAEKRSFLLANHGLLMVGPSIEEATTLAIVFERAARLQLLARSIGHVHEVLKAACAEAHSYTKKPI